MKPFGVVLLFIVLQTSTSGQQTPDDPNTESQVREQADRYFDAFDHRDVKTLDDLLVEECQIYYPRGVTDTKAILLEALRKPVPAGSAQPAHTLSDMKIRHVGDTVMLNVILTATHVDDPGVNNTNRRTLTWTRQEGRWRLMHDQWSLVGDASEAEYWSDYFHGKDQNFKRDPNVLLTQAVEGRRPGKALDVGVGEGRNAIYLAKQGWEVTGIDRAEGALAVARQHANKQGVKITPILQTAEEFDWGREQWDLIALLYVNAVRKNIDKLRESLKPGGLVVVEAFMAPPGTAGHGTEYEPGELRKLFGEGFEILRYEEIEGVADYGQKSMQLVRLIGCKTTQPAPSCQTSQPVSKTRALRCRAHEALTTPIPHRWKR
jgi:2-polyprenyl-3-methyl-5-hydroxy-6-metoxy-1,4-benzoquinol methylase